MLRLKKTQEIGGRPKYQGKCRKVLNPCSVFELSITVLIGGGDVNCWLLENINHFMVEKMLARKCLLERGGVTYHLHFQMVAQLEARSVLTIAKVMKEYLGWHLKNSH